MLWAARHSSRPALDTNILSFADGQEFDLTAHVIRDGRLRRGAFGELQQSVGVEADEITTDSGQHLPVHCGVRLTIYRRDKPRPNAASPDLTARDTMCIFRLRRAPTLSGQAEIAAQLARCFRAQE